MRKKEATTPSRTRNARTVRVKEWLVTPQGRSPRLYALTRAPSSLFGDELAHGEFMEFPRHTLSRARHVWAEINVCRIFELFKILPTTWNASRTLHTLSPHLVSEDFTLRISVPLPEQKSWKYFYGGLSLPVLSCIVHACYRYRSMLQCSW